MRKLWPQVSRVIREPRRLTRLHYSKVFSLLHQIFEKDDLATLRAVLDVTRDDFGRYQQALIEDSDFRDAIEARFAEIRGQHIRLFGETSYADFNPSHRLLYYCTRICRPSIIVETGVLDGFSSAFWLKGLHDNGFGHLYSIDFPSRTKTRSSSERMTFSSLPVGMDPGWVIPEHLRQRFDLRLGSARELLAPLLEELGAVDIFYHDSLHTREHMHWEYRTAFPFLSVGGLLVSDDVFWNRAFQTFTREANMRTTIARGIGISQRCVTG